MHFLAIQVWHSLTLFAYALITHVKAKLNNVSSHLFNKAINGSTASQLFQEAISRLWYPRQHASNGDAGKFTVYVLHSSLPIPF